MEGKRSVRAVANTFTTTTMAMNTTVSRVAMPPRLNLLEAKGFFPFFLGALGAPACLISVCFVSIFDSSFSSSGGFPPYGR